MKNAISLLLVFCLLSPFLIEAGTKKINFSWSKDEYCFKKKTKLKAGKSYEVNAKRTDKESQPSMPTFKLYFKSEKHSEDYVEFSVFPSAKSGETVSWEYTPGEDNILLRLETEGISRQIKWKFWIN